MSLRKPLHLQRNTEIGRTVNGANQKMKVIPEFGDFRLDLFWVLQDKCKTDLEKGL